MHGYQLVTRCIRQDRECSIQRMAGRGVSINLKVTSLSADEIELIDDDDDDEAAIFSADEDDDDDEAEEPKGK